MNTNNSPRKYAFGYYDDDDDDNGQKRKGCATILLVIVFLFGIFSIVADLIFIIYSLLIHV